MTTSLREDVAAFNERPADVSDELVARIKDAVRDRYGVPAHVDLKIGKGDVASAVYVYHSTPTCESIVRVSFSLD